MLTTHDDPARAVAAGVAAILAAERLPASRFTRVVHATTLFTNALIERKGAPTGLITTAGFRDTLEIGRERKFELYDVNIARPEPLVPRHLRLEVTERDQGGRERQRSARRGGGAGAGRRARPRRRRVHRGGVPPRLREPRARGGGRARDHRGASRRGGHRVARGGGGDPRVRAHLHRGGQRVHPAAGPSLSGADGRSGGRAGHRRAAPAHAVERRAHPRGRGPARAGAHARVGAGGGRARRRLLRPRGRGRGPPRLRHGRHHRQALAGGGRRAARRPELRGGAAEAVRGGQRLPDPRSPPSS